MGAKKSTKDDWEKLEARAETFGRSIGLVCKIPEARGIVDGIYILYASPPDKIESVINDDGNEFINFGSDEERALNKKAELEQEGCHVYIGKAWADATGRMHPSYYKDPVKFVETLFHEGFHNNPCNEMHKLIEEAGSYFMGIEGAIAFFSIFGNEEFVKTSKNRRKNFGSMAQRFSERYQRRLDELSEGAEIPASSKYNNAFMIMDRACFLYYPLIRKVHEKVGYLGETRSNLTGLPSDLDGGIKRLEALASGHR